ncbi:MAG TPA: OsmC family protein [Symbiobacteriaceae bacterium]|nr:OsmC family protein [Symbiobacteriaceae bacterium]
MKEALVTWTGGMSFNGRTGSGHDVVMDARPDVGGENKGPRPTELLLTALGGCTGMDVVSVLKKMRVDVDRLEMAIEAEERAEHPKHFEKITMVYRIWGPEIPEEKFRRAVELSFTTYCSVGALLKKGAEVSYRLELNGNPLS